MFRFSLIFVYGHEVGISNGSISTITANTTLLNQNYTWWINCSDGANTNISEKRNIKIYVDVYEPSVSLDSPSDNAADLDFSSIGFSCSATDDIYLKNISLYSDYSGEWQFIDNKSISGLSDSVTFTKNIYQTNQFVNNYFIWNCLAYDNTSKSNWSSANYTFSNWDLGSHSNTVYNTTLNAITLNDYSSDGIYTSDVFDAGSVVGWRNISWNSNAVNIDSGVDFFNDGESKNYYSENDYSVRHWYDISSIVSDFSQLKVQAALDCDGSCSGTVEVRIGNSTDWSDYSFVDAASIRTDGTTSDYTYYNSTYDISMDDVGDYFFVQLLIYTGSGTVKFLMDESGPTGPDPEYRSGNNGDGSQTGWTNDNGDYAIKIKLIKNTNLNLSTRSCDDPDCNGESWSESLDNSTISELPVSNNRYFQYKANLESSGGLDTPKLYNVTINYGAADSEKPSVTLSSPIDKAGDDGNLTTFIYSVDDESEIEECELVLNGIIQDTDDSVEKGVTQEFNILDISAGTYEWYINCTDISGNENSSEIRELTIVPSYDYSGQKYLIY
jgi:hypothetical protein